MIPKKRSPNFVFGRRHIGHRCQQNGKVYECSLDEVVLDIETVVARIALDYRRLQGLILSEDDLKCALYRKLHPMYSVPIPTLDYGISAIALHTEIPWYNEDGLLTLRPDISIIDPRKLSILHGIDEHPRRNAAIHYRLPSKGFEFGGQAVAVETKFVRALGGISQRHIVSFQRDIDKMQRLGERHNVNSQSPNVKGVLVIFSKTGRGSHNVDEFIRQNSALKDIKIFYYSAGVEDLLPRRLR